MEGNLENMPSYPSFRGTVNLATAVVTDNATGIQYEYYDWKRYIQTTLVDLHRKMCYARDPASDLTNLPGTKPWFVDDWFDVVRPVRRPPPWRQPNLSPNIRMY